MQRPKEPENEVIRDPFPVGAILLIPMAVYGIVVLVICLARLVSQLR